MATVTTRKPKLVPTEIVVVLKREEASELCAAFWSGERPIPVADLMCNIEDALDI